MDIITYFTIDQNPAPQLTNKQHSQYPSSFWEIFFLPNVQYFTASR